MKQITRGDLEKLSHKDRVRFTIFCAEQVFHLVDDSRKEASRKAIDTAKSWLEGKATEKVCKEAANEADYTAHASAHSTAYYAAYSAYNNVAYAPYAAASDSADISGAFDGLNSRQQIIKEQWDYYNRLNCGILWFIEKYVKGTPL